MSDWEFPVFLAVALSELFLPVANAWRKGRVILPVALLSLVFQPGALVLALQPLRWRDQEPQPSSMMSIIAPAMNKAEDPSTAPPSRF